MTKGRKAPSSPKPPPKAAAQASPPASSEQANEEEEQTVLSQLETENSAALAAASTGEGEQAQTPPETPETPPEEQAQADPEGAGEVEAEGEAAPKTVRDLQKRVGKLTAQRNEARDELAELRSEVAEMRAELKGAKPPEATSHPAAEAFEADGRVVEIDEELGHIAHFQKWAEANPDGGPFKVGEKTWELDGDSLRDNVAQMAQRKIRLEARREVRLERLSDEFKVGRDRSHAEAVRLYPWITDKATPEFQEALSIVRANPDVLKRVDFELIVARQVVGLRLEKEALKKAKPGGKPGVAGPRTTGAPAPVVTFSPSASPKPEKSAATISAAEKQFREGGGKEGDLSKLLAQRRLARLEAAKAG